jgi:hypothetical protein
VTIGTGLKTQKIRETDMFKNDTERIMFLVNALSEGVKIVRLFLIASGDNPETYNWIIRSEKILKALKPRIKVNYSMIDYYNNHNEFPK